MKNITIQDYPHRRYNALTGEWVLVSPHRAKRPWQGQVEEVEKEQRPQYDPSCYLCPTNQRVGGVTNPDYKNTFVFNNDFSSLLPDVPNEVLGDGDLFRAESEQGLSKVICFSPRHDLTIPDMELDDIVKVVDTWQQEYKELGSKPFINHVQIFENKGSMMGCSNPHPHGQIWAQSTIPNEPAKEDSKQREYFDKHRTSLLSDYLKKELDYQDRIVYQNEHFVVLCPYWAVWPFETLIAGKRHFQNLLQMSTDEKRAFADAYKNLTMKYDKLFGISFPYSAGIHQSPTNGQPNEHWHFHMHFFPPLLRSATVKKFMVGYEMLANAQRDITPETAAARLREV